MSARHVAFAVFAVFALGVVLVLPRPAPASAQEAPPAIEAHATLDTPSATLGQHVHLTVTVRHPGSVLVTIDRPSVQSNLEVVSAGAATTEADATGDLATTTRTFVLAAFALGPVQPAAIPVSWLRSNGTTGTISVQPPSIAVIAVRAPGDNTLRPLKPQAGVPGAPPAWTGPAGVAGAVLAVAIAAGAGATWEHRRRRRAARERPAAPDVTPETRAREQLDALLLPTRDVAEHYQRFYGAISFAVREYLQARFGFNATALTQRELQDRMVGRGVDRWQARLVSGLLERCDAAVYAHDYPEPASADHDLTLAYEIVELSRPRGGDVTGEPAVPA